MPLKKPFSAPLSVDRRRFLCYDVPVDPTVPTIYEVRKMKKILCICLCLVLVLMTASEALAAGKLPSINSVLKKGTKKKVEVSADLSAYSINNAVLKKLGKNIKLLILERRAPGKQFTELKKEAPVTEDDGFPDTFKGKDTGKARIWVRGDLMAKVPARYRAKSMKEATYILMAETVYFHSRSLMHYAYKNSIYSYLPEKTSFESTEEMIAYYAMRQPELESITFYPMFDAYSLVTMYEVKTKKYSVQDYKQVKTKDVSKNPTAAKRWENMGQLMKVIRALQSDEGVNASSVKKMISDLSFVASKNKNNWTSFINQKDYQKALTYTTNYYWSMAEKLRDEDTDEQHKANYNLIIANRDAAALEYYVKDCNYSGLKESIESIRDSKEYLAKPDTKWLDKALKKVLNKMLGK